MAPLSTYPQRYLTYNTQQTKTPALVIQIDGVDTLATTPIFERVRYGDPSLLYGQAGIVYGGLRRVAGVRDILSWEGSSLTLGQKVEPEQGRAATSLLTLSFLDQGEYMSQVISPGVLIDEILGRKIRVYLGFVETSFPEDYFTVFRGYVSGTVSQPGRITIEISDPNFKRRQQLFYTAKSRLSAPITSSSTFIPMSSAGDFHNHVLGPDGTYDSSVKTYLKIEEEWLEYAPGAIAAGGINVTTRGARGSTAVAHDGATEVQAAIQLTGTAIDLALKIMLSGWAGAYKTGVEVRAFKNTGLSTLGDISNAIILPVRTDAVEDLGLSIGDYFTVSGSGSGNNVTGQIIGFQAWDDLPNRIILTDQTFNSEPDASGATLALRSQFDTFPTTAGLKLDPTDVDVSTHLTVRNNFLSQDILEFFLQTPQNGKTFLENEIYLVEGAYPITRYGKLSVNLTRPPIADQLLIFLDENNILEPDRITLKRATNNRRFFNEIRYDYDVDEDGKFQSVLRLLDTESLSQIGVSSVLPVKSLGLKSAQSGAVIANRRGRFLLVRYKLAAFELSLKVNWEAGSQIEAGDVVVVKDKGALKVTNLTSGKRDLGVQLFEVIDRKLDLRSGNVTLSLLSNVGFDLSDRYATIAPSSRVNAGSTTTRINLKNSYGEVFPGEEQKKWLDYQGLPILVHSYDWSQVGTTTFQGFDTTNDHQMIVDPPLAFAPAEDHIVEIADYPTDTDPEVNEDYKSIHAFISPSIPVVAGLSNQSFTVSLSDAAKFQVGLPVYVRTANYATFSEEVNVLSVVGTTVTVDDDLGFTPAAGNIVELVGYADGRGAYRII